MDDEDIPVLHASIDLNQVDDVDDGLTDFDLAQRMLSSRKNIAYEPPSAINAKEESQKINKTMTLMSSQLDDLVTQLDGFATELNVYSSRKIAIDKTHVQACDDMVTRLKEFSNKFKVVRRENTHVLSKFIVPESERCQPDITKSDLSYLDAKASASARLRD